MYVSYDDENSMCVHIYIVHGDIKRNFKGLFARPII